MLILSGDDVQAALSMDAAIEHTRRAFAAAAEGRVIAPSRTHLAAWDADGVTLVMPARIESETPALAVKVVSVFQNNPAAGLARTQAAVVVLDPGTGRPLALLEGSALTAIRTAAASGLATDLLARADAERLAILGAGVQARSHIEAMCAVRSIRSITVYGPTRDNVEALLADVSDHLPRAAEIRAADSAADAVRGADIICATTTSARPVFDDADVEPGAHVNAVGSYTPEAREISGATVARSWVVVDERSAAWSEAGDLIQARAEGRIGTDHVRADLAELVVDPSLRPRDRAQPTLFKSVGIAVQDAATGAAALEEAMSRGLGTRVDW